MSLIESFFGYDYIVNAIIRPKRERYEMAQLGPKLFSLSGKRCVRTDVCLFNRRGHELKCSHFEPETRPRDLLPCVVYLHGNSSCRLEGLNCVSVMLPLNVTVFCFDFSGCGMSDGEYVSLGWFERDDLATVITYLRTDGRASRVGIWGRSMGAVTALLEGYRDPSIAGIVCDSAFTSLTVLAQEIAQKTITLPSLLVETALSQIRKTIFKRAKFDMEEISPINFAHESYVPVIFGYGISDTFVVPAHSIMLYDKYAGDKTLIAFEGDHGSKRPDSFNYTVAGFFYTALDVAELPLCMDPF